MLGLKSSTIDPTAFKATFISIIVKYMTGMRRSDVHTDDLSEITPKIRPLIGMRSNVLPEDLSGADSRVHIFIPSAFAGPSSAITFNASRSLAKLHSTDPAAAYSRLVRELNNSMTSGSFKADLKATSALFSNVSRAYITLLGYKVSTASSPSLSPTSSPTVVTAIPSVNYITILSVTRSSVSLAVNLASVINTGGSLYCAALSVGTILSSVGAVKSASRDGSMSRGTFTSMAIGTTNTINLNMTINNLDAVERYKIYCYAEASNGKGNSLRQVVQTSVATTTACCKLVQFTNAPKYVYSDISAYNASSSALFVFSYSLPSIPSGELRVNHRISVDGVNSSVNIAAVPSSLLFTGQSSQAGYFYLSSDLIVTTNCFVSLSFTGTHASNYTNIAARVTILGSNEPKPSPLMESCQFSDSGDSISILFDSSTDEAGINGVRWACSTLFNFIGASLSTCVWIDSKRVSVEFPVVTTALSDANLVMPGGSVTLKGKLLRAFCTRGRDSCSLDPTAIESSISISAPINPMSPVVVIAAPSSLSSCLDLTLDAADSYGHGGRLYSSVVWSVTALGFGASAAAVEVSSLEEYLNEFSALYQVQRPFTILRSSLTSATYSITLTLRNYFGLSSSSTVSVDVIIDETTPALNIIGAAYQTMLASSYLSIHSAASLSGCASATTSLKYSWAVQLNGLETDIRSTSPDPTTFSLLPYSLAADQTYTVTLTASAGVSSSSASVKVYVPHGDMSAAVAGGYSRSVPVDKDMVLDASNSSDADISPNKTSGLLYKVIIPRLICMDFIRVKSPSMCVQLHSNLLTNF
jgi:REJ domain